MSGGAKAGARELGPFDLYERLGAGGMGVVYRGVERATGRAVAVKLLRVEGAPPETLRRFEREARALAAIEHPHVVRCLAFDQTDEGELYLAMELLEGESLGERLRRTGRLSPDEVVTLGLQACRALAAAHAAGVIHRDIKPGNLHMTPAGAKLLDFGLALLVAVDETRLTAPGTVIGTPSYMAPEQALGRRSEDPRSDVWSLGAVLYHALSGRPPFAAPTALAELVRIVHEEPDPLPELPGPGGAVLLAAVRGALRRQPEDRWASADVFAAALRGAEGAGDTIHARGQGVGSGAGSGAAAGSAAGAGRPTPVTPGPDGLLDEVRLVSVVVADGLSDGDAFMGAVRGQGGEAAALIGGRGVGVFGGAESEGREAERAVRAAQEARGAALRIGVGTGRALTERGRFGAFTGDIVASAERALAATGVGIDEATDRQIQHAFRIERPAPGEAGPRRVVGSFAEPGPAAAWAPLRRRTPTAGRDVEMAQLRDLFERAADERSPASALVHGPPGAGKTRLCWDLVHWLHQLGEPTVVLQGRGDVARCYRSWAAFASALRPLAGLDDVPRDGDAAGERAGEMQRRLLRMCAEAGLAGGTSADAPAFLGELLGVPFPETPALRAARYDARVLRDQVQMAVGALVDALAAHATVVLVLEDLHVADTPSLELADYLLLGPRPLLLVGTARPHILSERPHLLPGAVRLELRPLPRRAVRQIVRGVLGRDDDAIAERAAGNPYFAEELALGALEDEARGGAPPRELPLTVQGAVQARLDHLPAEEKDLVKRAAVLGVRFWADALAELGAPAPAPALARLRRRGLVEPLPSSALAGCAEWTFHQAPLQEVAHAMLTPSQAEALHRAAANWLQRRADAPDEQVAAHLEAAGAPEEAAPLWARAAETADARGMSEAVLDQAARALPWVGDPAARLRLHDLRCQALFFMGRMDERLREIEAMEALAEHVGGGAPALVAYRRAHQLRRMGRVAEAADLTRAALARARAGADEEWTVRLLGLLAGALVEHGRPAEAVPLADEALARARARGEPVLLRDAIEWRAYVAGWAGDPCTSLRLYQETARLMTAAGDVRRAAAARMNAGMSLSQLAAWSAARAEFEASIEMCDRLGLARTRGYALDGLAIALLHGGDAAGARAAVEAALALVELSGDVRLRVSALVDRSAVRLAAGDARGALEDAQAALAAEPVAEMDAAPRATLARALLATGDAAGALREAERAISRRAAGAPVEQLEVEAHLCAHDALVALGRAAEASAAAVCAGAVVRARAERLDDAEQRAVFERHAPHARAVALAAAAAAANPAPAAPAP